ncbi:hypothetical protein M5E87_25660 [Flavonifractor plautii]|nr:hypothetical protein M5E87_25660 [Flavonifractor plautii]
MKDQEQAKAILEAAGYIDTDGDGWREQPDGTPMDVLVTPQYNATKAALYQRIAEIIVTNLGRLASSAPWMRRVSAIPTTSSSSGMTGPMRSTSVMLPRAYPSIRRHFCICSMTI